MKQFLNVVLVLLLIVAGLLIFAPRTTMDWRFTFQEDDLGDDLDAYLVAMEGFSGNLRPGTAKEIIWASEPGRKTPLSIIYLHGFAGSRAELEPVLRKVATEAGANLYFARLTGHGKGRRGLVDARAEDWLNDAVEALSIGKRLGDRTVVVGVSAGAGAAVLAVSDPGLSGHVAGLAMISPVVGLRVPRASFLTLPFAHLWARYIGPPTLVIPEGAVESRPGWTYEVPGPALLPVVALAASVAAIDAEYLRLPLMLVHTANDPFVDPHATGELRARWGGPIVVYEERIDPGNSVLPWVPGEIRRDPDGADLMAERLKDWILTL